MKGVFKNYKTSIFGLLAALLSAKSGGFTWGAVAQSLPTLFMGLVAKDADVTGAHPLIGNLAVGGAMIILGLLVFAV